MKVINVDVFTVRVPLKGKFTTSQSSRTHQESVVVEVCTDEGMTGLGNVDPSPKYSTETTEEIVTCLNGALIPAVIDKDPRDIVLRLNDMERAVVGNYHAKATLEMAFQDLTAKDLGIPVCRLLGGPVCERVSIIPSWIGHISPEEGANKAVKWVEKGYRTLKIKVGMGVEEDIERIRAIRQAVGPEVYLRLDANEGYTPEKAIKAIRGFAPYQILYCEQPVPREDWDGMARVRKSVDVPIMADEGILTPKDIVLAVEKGAADIVKVKVMKNGGLYGTGRMIWLAGSLGLKCVLGHGFTLGINSLSEIHLAAALPNIMMPIETTGMLKVEEDIILEPIQVDDGWIKVPMSPGLGVALDREKLLRFQV
ncbi:MAG: dipeptide epimerase [Deltaproteobacteria bacterium]|nr:dipeptide epimerase [Deltaproteobacteria bacterium]